MPRVVAISAGIVIALGCARSPEREIAPGGLGPPAVVSLETGQGATPMFAVLADGGRVLSWVGLDSTEAGETSVLHVRVDRAAASAVASRLIDPLGGVEPHGEAPPQLAAGLDGALYALYTVGKDVGERYPVNALRFSRSVDGGRSWAEPVTVNEGPAFGAQSFHAITAGAGTDVYATWLNNSPADAGVWLRRSPDGGVTWDAARRVVPGPACPCCRTAVAVAPDGRIYVAWRGVSSQGVRDIQVISSIDRGETWTTAVEPRDDGWYFDGCPHAGPALRVDPTGEVHIAWWTGAPNGRGVWYARSSDRGTTWAAMPVDNAATAPVSHVQLAVSGRRVVLAWEGGPALLPATFARLSSDGGRAFAPAQQMSTPGVAATFPVVGLFGDSLVVAWSQVGDAGYRALLEHHREPDAPGERMALPRIGEQEVIARRGRIDALQPQQ